MKKRIDVWWLTGLAGLILVVVGCHSEDERLAEYAERSVQRQADQNREMAELNRDVADAIQSVSTDQKESRKEYTELLSQIQSQHDQVAAETSKLAEERRLIERERQRDAVLAPIFSTIGGVLVCLLPLFVVWKLLMRDSGDDSSNDALVELLANELVAEHPLLLPPPTRDSIADSPLIEAEGDNSTEQER